MKYLGGCLNAKEIIEDVDKVLDFNMEEIKEDAFHQCSSLRCVELPDNLRRIGDCAFARFLGVNIEELNGEE